jgi:hypothetical protein
MPSGLAAASRIAEARAHAAAVHTKAHRLGPSRSLLLRARSERRFEKRSFPCKAEACGKSRAGSRTSMNGKGRVRSANLRVQGRPGWLSAKKRDFAVSPTPAARRLRGPRRALGTSEASPHDLRSAGCGCDFSQRRSGGQSRCLNSSGSGRSLAIPAFSTANTPTTRTSAISRMVPSVST